jgi:hypothetical protein
MIALRSVLLVVWFAGAVAGPAALQRSPERSDSRSWQAAYDDGLAASKRGDWAGAEQAFRTAIAKGGKDRSARVLFYGTRREPFYPEYYLAVALMNGGKPTEAAALFDRIQREKLVPANAQEFSQIAANIQKAQDLARSTPAATGPTVFQSSAQGPGNTRGQNTATPSGPAGPSAADIAKARQDRDRFELLLTNANTELATKRLTTARQAANEAKGLGIDAARADALLKRIDVEDAIESTRAAVAAGNVADARRLADRVRSLDAANTELPAILKQIDQLVAASATAALERTAMRRFYSGQYKQALETMSPLLGQSGGSPRIYFYAACSNAALGLLEANGDERLKAARELFAKARPFANELAADRRFVSPRILEVLDAGKLP